jgi:hypothetical protein
MYFGDGNGVLIEAKDLVNGVSIVQADSAAQIEYFHIELETHDMIVAEGALSETFVDDDSRGLFHNADEYRTLYTDAPPQPARYYAPRLEQGYEVEAVRRRIVLRAGLIAPDSAPRVGALRGSLDLVSERHIAGWAQTSDRPEAPVCLDIYAGDERIGQVLANNFREDLKRAGLGSGNHGFAFTAPAGAVFAPDEVQVRRSVDGARLGSNDGAPRVSETNTPRVKIYRRAAVRRRSSQA